MSEAMIECEEVAGKTVQSLRLATAESGAQEVHLEFTDGTAFSLTIEPVLVRKAELIALSEGKPETIRHYGE